MQQGTATYGHHQRRCPHCQTPIGSRQPNCGSQECRDRAEVAYQESVYKRLRDV